MLRESYDKHFSAGLAAFRQGEFSVAAKEFVQAAEIAGSVQPRTNFFWRKASENRVAALVRLHRLGEALAGMQTLQEAMQCPGCASPPELIQLLHS